MILPLWDNSFWSLCLEILVHGCGCLSKISDDFLWVTVWIEGFGDNLGKSCSVIEILDPQGFFGDFSGILLNWCVFSHEFCLFLRFYVIIPKERSQVAIPTKKLTKISIEKITIPKVRANSKFTGEQEEFFKASIKKFGVLQPVLVRPLSDGNYELIGGKARLTEVKEKGASEIDAIVLETSEKDSLMMHIAENLARGKSDHISVAKVLKKAQEQGTKVEELAKVTGHDPSWVKFHIGLLGLPEVYQEAISKDELALGVIEQSSRLTTPEEMDYCLSHALQLGWTTSITKRYVDNRLEELKAAQTQSEELKKPVEAPEPEVERLIKYGDCWFCKRKVPSETLYMRILCGGCRDLLQYVLDNLGPPEKAMDLVFKALGRYLKYQKLQELQREFPTASPETSPEPKRETAPIPTPAGIEGVETEKKEGS